MRRMRRRYVLYAVGLGLAVLGAACTNSSSRGPPGHGRSVGRSGTAITVGSFDFPESVLLAYIYADALAAKGFPVRVLPDLGTRELVDPALMNGLIQLVPEYAGSALDFMSLGRVHATPSAAATYRSLARSAARRGLVAAQPAPAQDANAIVVTAATAARYHLRSIADLMSVAPGLVFGGPPECRERADCLPGLERSYGLRFRAFTPTDAGGPLTLQALDSGQIGVGLLFTTDPSIPAQHLVILADNHALQPAENVTPLLRRSTLDRYGARLVATLNAVSARLSTGTLRYLDAQVELAGQRPRSVADSWLRAQALIPAEPGVP
jgi:osmoprotectant transport system substrate-binding protein